MAISGRMRVEVFTRDRFTCVYCGHFGKEVRLEVDHVVPRSRGGPDHKDNLVTACELCNRGKSNVPAVTPSRLMYSTYRQVADSVPGDYEEVLTVALEISPADVARKPWVRDVLLLARMATVRWNLKRHQSGAVALLLISDIERGMAQGFSVAQLIKETADVLAGCMEGTYRWYLENIGHAGPTAEQIEAWTAEGWYE